ncbi:glycosyltransferase [Bdellovibrio sp. NC01]|uniref:glycosyltransferase n=1 Tax=Bdellovibrio sp. NC01 TaxID=2220073 RepID=UPI00143DE226|nr:glycosyltransferase [Bdellovibrio sp. NC01]
MGQKKHLVFFCEHLESGGAAQAQIDFLTSIDPNKYQLSLVLERSPSSDNHLFSQIPKNVAVRTLFPENSNFPQKYNSLFWNFLRCRSEKFDKILRIKEVLSTLPKADCLIGFTLTYPKYLPFFRKQYKLVYWVHGPCTKWSKGDLRKFYRRILPFDQLITVSHVLEEHIKDFFPRVSNRVRTVYTPINYEKIRSEADDFSELTALEQKLIGQKYYVAVARFVPEKDFVTVFKAFKILKEKNFNLKLVVVGDGTDRKKLERSLEDLSLQGCVSLVGMKRNPYVWMKHSQGFIHSAITEGFGLVMVEAMTLGKAVIATDCPVGPAEVLKNGEFGILIKVGDDRNLAEKIIELESKASLKQRYELKSLERASYFSKERILPEFYEIIDSL